MLVIERENIFTGQELMDIFDIAEEGTADEQLEMIKDIITGSSCNKTAERLISHIIKRDYSKIQNILQDLFTEDINIFNVKMLINRISSKYMEIFELGDKISCIEVYDLNFTNFIELISL